MSEQPKFTPGPWQVCRLWICEENDPGHNVGICIIEERDEAPANAHLIAAAPDLYKALQACVEYWRDVDVPCPPALHDQVTNALHKATGEQP